MKDLLDRRRAQCLIQILETGSVRGAAEALDMDPSVVSRSIAKLEEDLGLTLLERRGRGVIVTDAGRLLSRFARRQQDLQATFLAEVNSLKSAQVGHVELALGEGFVDIVFEPILREFIVAHPGVTYNIRVAGTEETVTYLLEDMAHLGLVFQPPNDERLHSHYSRLAPIRVHVHKDHPLTRLPGPLKLADLMDHAGAALAGSFGVRKHVQAAELDEHVTLKPMLETDSFKVLWEFAAMGLGYILTPRSVPLMGPQFSALVALPLANPLLNNSRIHLMTRTGRPLAPVGIALRQHIVDTLPRI